MEARISKVSPKRGWKNILESRAGNKTKYYVLIILFTVLFFICMAFCFVRFVKLAHDHKVNSLSYRMESLQLDETMFGVEHDFSSLYFNYDYEEEFDEHWAFSDAYLAYIKGKISEDKTPYIEELKAYLDTAPGGEKEKAARQYLEELEGR